MSAAARREAGAPSVMINSTIDRPGGRGDRRVPMSERIPPCVRLLQVSSLIRRESL